MSVLRTSSNNINILCNLHEGIKDLLFWKRHLSSSTQQQQTQEISSSSNIILTRIMVKVGGAYNGINIEPSTVASGLIFLEQLDKLHKRQDSYRKIRRLFVPVKLQTVKK